MSGDNHYTANTGQVRSLVIGIAIGVFILYTLSGIHPPAHPKPPSLPPGVNTYRNYVDHPQEAQEHLNLLARQTNGDIKKLSPEDHQWLDSMTAGNGEMMLKTRAQELKSPAAKAK